MPEKFAPQMVSSINEFLWWGIVTLLSIVGVLIIWIARRIGSDIKDLWDYIDKHCSDDTRAGEVLHDRITEVLDRISFLEGKHDRRKEKRKK